MDLLKLANWLGCRPVWLGLSIGILSLTACAGGLDTELTADAIKQEFESAGINLKAVKCPRPVKKAAEVTFSCTGELENNSSFVINVTQTDDQGNVTWDVPHAKGLLNLAKLETLFRSVLETEVGVKAEVSCGATYRMVSAGDSFECQVLNQSPVEGKPAKGSKDDKQAMTDKIVVRVDGDGNVSWQRVLPDVAVKPASADKKPASQQTKSPEALPSPEPQNEPVEEPSSAPPPAQSGKDFLSQPGALDDF